MTDCLLLHVPKFQNRYPALGNYVTIQWMALGLLGIADTLDKAGLSARVMHLGLEKALNSKFRIRNYLASEPSPVVAVSIHWHQQLYDSLRACDSIKTLPNPPFVVLGGLTAGFFAQEILEKFPSVDAIVTGEGEKPLRELVAAIKKGERDFSRIPNLIWRQDGKLIVNTDHYMANQEELDQIDFANFSLMIHGKEYISMPKIFSRLKVSGQLHWKLSTIISQKKKNICYGLSVGRGCVTNCIFCGGGLNAHRLLTGRGRAILRSPEKVIETIKKLISWGYQGAYASFDPLPRSDAYYQDLFRRIRAENIEFTLHFSSWGLPSKGFIEEYGKTFTPDSVIAISPETGSEPLRKKVRGIYYSNEQLIELLHFSEQCKVRTGIFYSLGLPGETREDLEASLELKKKIESLFNYSSVSAYCVEIEPAAPWYLFPDRYGIIVVQKTLEEFLKAEKDPHYSPMSGLGYYQPSYLGESISGPEEYAQKVLALKCKYYCDQKALCTAASCFWKVADLFSLSKSGDEDL